MDTKAMFGMVETPDATAAEMVGLVQPAKRLVWLECGAGLGAIGAAILARDPTAARVDMVEVNPNAVAALHQRFPPHRWPNARIVQADFLATREDAEYDAVVANPPYNVGGAIKTPTNTEMDKRKDGRVVWRAFVERAVSLLRPGGQFVFLIPSAWLRDQGNPIYDLLIRANTTLTIRCMSNTETNQLFRNQAQTPTCIVHGYKGTASSPSDAPLLQLNGTPIPRWLSHETPTLGLPTAHTAAFIALAERLRTEPSVAPLVIKTTHPRKGVTRSSTSTTTHTHPNVRTCLLKKTRGLAKKTPILLLEYTDRPTKFQTAPYAGRPKLIMAHKMYGLPFFDASGVYGVTNADSYVIFEPNDNVAKLRAIQETLLHPLSILTFDGMRYRMRFLEREAFDYVPLRGHDTKASNALSLSLSLSLSFALQEPDTQEPGTQEPGTQEPGTQEPGTQEPGTQEPGTGTKNT